VSSFYAVFESHQIEDLELVSREVLKRAVTRLDRERDARAKDWISGNGGPFEFARKLLRYVGARSRAIIEVEGIASRAEPEWRAAGGQTTDRDFMRHALAVEPSARDLLVLAAELLGTTVPTRRSRVGSGRPKGTSR
jgi:hypothetical protein